MGYKTSNNLGNHRLRGRVKEVFLWYNAGTHDQKRLLVDSLIAYIHKSDGRFLKQDKESIWHEATLKESRTKVTKLIRCCYSSLDCRWSNAGGRFISKKPTKSRQWAAAPPCQGTVRGVWSFGPWNENVSGGLDRADDSWCRWTIPRTSSRVQRMGRVVKRTASGESVPNAPKGRHNNYLFVKCLDTAPNIPIENYPLLFHLSEYYEEQLKCVRPTANGGCEPICRMQTHGLGLAVQIGNMDTNPDLSHEMMTSVVEARIIMRKRWPRRMPRIPMATRRTNRY